MRYYAFLVLAISSIIVSSEEINGLDKNVFRHVKDVSKATGSKEETFVETIWSELSRFLPESARVPGVELSLEPTTEEDLEENSNKVSESTVKGKYWYENFMCSFECKIYPKLAETVSTKVVTKVDGKSIQKNEDRVVVEVNAKFSMNEKTMDYKLFEKLGGSNNAKGPINVSYKFDEKSNIRLILDIPDDSMLSAITDANCLVNIRSVEVTGVSTPTLVNSLSTGDEEIAETYWDIIAVKLRGMREVMSIGIRRAINLKLENEGNYWVCLSEEMKKQVETDEEQFKYNPIYDEFCKDAKIAD